ncbi:hydroxymethylglutaryl-CoA reductase [Geofilum rubicundum]|uniref:Hydroxymethylglutaryl-CoA reductase n=1 Tax=Geofilum rubicundum JCM 15548 TaxID=1236989 RepID=A0A0E9M353_9BACT|nr:hydroxymethylglutaryl-CoA reductase [Geofilum rubicundum]GAO31605.1 hydroxymethylglutaryl-CoA reductase [Geofilum rubicundum JCM 15548]
MPIIKGFSKLSRAEKISHLTASLPVDNDLAATLAEFRHPARQALFDDFSENTLTNYYMPFGVAPNFLIDEKWYVVPMVIEESSVVAAASRAASFWAQNGGFKTTIHNTLKVGHIWLEWAGPPDQLLLLQDQLGKHLTAAVRHLTASMEQREGGIRQIEVIPQKEMTGIYQLQVTFSTADSMGANFINSCLEGMKEPLLDFFAQKKLSPPNIIMAILSNHTPDCLVTCSVDCPAEQLAPYAAGLPIESFVHRFKTAVDIAIHNTHRAVTHNKGIYNGIDAVVLATGNDFRAVEAAGHAYAARDGQYRSLSSCTLSDNGHFSFSLTVPLALGTVGGLTRLHPMAAKAMEILQQPSAEELMSIAAAAGLANNFSAVASLVTTGIQKGHMKLHLSNILNSLGATEQQKAAAQDYFKDQTVSQKAVREFLEKAQ